MKPASLQHGWWPLETRFSGPLGSHTASVDWCEPNYEVIAWIAEGINTLTSLPFALVALIAMIDLIRQRLPIRTLLPPAGILAVCAGSAWFHGTLSKPGQLADELPMLDFTALCSLHVAVAKMPDEKRSYLDVLVPAAIVAIAIGANVAYLRTDNFVFFAGSFATFLIAATVRGIYLTLNRPISESNRRELIYLASRGVIYFLLAFGIWNLDNLLCAHIVEFRRPFGLLGTMINGHGVWHILSNYAAFLLATGANLLNVVLTQPDVPVKLDWRFGIPLVRRAAVGKTNGKHD